MKSKSTLIFLITSICFATTSFAQPANDDACDAIELPVDGSIGNYNNLFATVQTGELAPPPSGCGTQDGWCNSDLTFTVWFKFVAPVSGNVTVNTCLPGSYDTQIAVWQTTDCADFGLYTLIGANDDKIGGCDAVAFASELYTSELTAGNTYFVQVDAYSTFTADTFNIQISEGSPIIPSDIKIIHNSADIALSTVDVRINGDFVDGTFGYLDNLSFRTSTDFFNVVTDAPIEITINPSGSIDDSAPLQTFTMSFGPGKHVVVLDGILSTTGYTPSNVEKPLSLYEYSDAIEYTTTFNYDTAHVLVHHGATDAPAVDVNVTNPNLGNIITALNYSEYAGYFDLVDNTNYTIEVVTNPGGDLVNTYIAPAQSDYWGGSGYTIVASGFVDPSQNSDGASFGLWAAGPFGGSLQPLATLGNFEFDNVCDAAAVAIGSSINLSNTGLTVEAGEPSPDGGSCYTTTTWCENVLSNTIWMKFVAPTSGDVTLTTCSESTNFNTQIAVYSGTCSDFSTFVQVGANDDIDFNDPDYCDLGAYGASRLPLCGLVSGNTYYVQLDGTYSDFGNFELSIEEGAICKARLKVIHNSADLAAAVVDVRVNGEFPDAGFFGGYLDDMEFRSSSDFITVDAETPLTITVNSADSEDDNSPLFTKIVTLAPNSTNIIIAEGIISTGGYVPAVFDLNLVSNAKEGNFFGTETDVLFYHGCTDGFSVDLKELGTNQTLASAFQFRDTTGYVTLPTSDNYLVQINLAGTSLALDSVQAALTSYNLGGAAITLCYSGFQEPINNSNGPELGMWFARSYGGAMQQFISPIQNDLPCGAILLPNDGSIVSGNNTGATTDSAEVYAPQGFEPQGNWGNIDPVKSVWYKFVAPSVGVEVSTCHENTILDTKIAIWEYTDCGSYATYNLKGAQDDAGSNCTVGLGFPGFSSIADMCGLTVGQTYLVQVCSYGSFTTPGAFDISIDSIFCVVGLDETKNISNFKIYPNPTNGTEVTVECANAKNSLTAIEILDGTGKLVKSYNYKNMAAGNFKQQLDVANLTNGLYFVNLVSDGKVASTKLQIIK